MYMFCQLKLADVGCWRGSLLHKTFSRDGAIVLYCNRDALSCVEVITNNDG